MKDIDPRCLFSIEQECQTTVDGVGRDGAVPPVLRDFLRAIADQAPSLPGPAGLFNTYGRVYVDVGNHLEFAAVECDSPRALAQVVEAQYTLAQRAVATVARKGVRLLLVNNNHSGLLRQGAAVWGTHENYLIDVPAKELSTLLMPFLVTRTFGGSGGVQYPEGVMLAATRPLAIARDTGGGTTHNRAIFSTCREEHHMGPNPKKFRLHLILGDGHRCHFNLALQLGATALALKAVQHDRELTRAIKRLTVRKRGETWVGALRRLNRLAEPGEEPTVDPEATAVQRRYLDSARKVVDRMSEPEPWMAGTLEAWQQTLDAYERKDRGWLSRRLDAFAKYEIFTSYLDQRGTSWKDLPGDTEAMSELTLLDHDYHAISEPGSIFERLDASGTLDHRVGPKIAPGEEAEPYVPDVGTRAKPRARFIKDHARDKNAYVNWDHAVEPETGATRWMIDPFATALATRPG